jgi:hypothetical protein
MLLIRLALVSELQYPASDIFPTILAEMDKERAG